MIKVTNTSHFIYLFCEKRQDYDRIYSWSRQFLGEWHCRGIKARKAARKANAVLDKQAKENEDWFNRRYNEDYTQSAEAQAALTKARELADEQYRKASGTAAVVGATDESVAQAKKAAGEVISDTASGIATNATARKDAVESQYLNTKNNISNQRLSIYNQQAANATQAANQGMQAGMNLVGADMQSHLDTSKGLFGNLWGNIKKNLWT